MYDTNQMPATITARGNIYDQTVGEQDEGPAPNKLGYVDAMDVMPYAYWLDEAEDVPELVQKYAGPVAADPDATPHPTAIPTPDLGPTPVPTPRPEVTPSPTPVAPNNDNGFKIEQDAEKGETIVFNGQNSDGTNGYLEFKNPFAGLDLSETPTYSGVYPIWTKGINISYWQYIPKGTDEAVAFSFNGTHRAIRDVDWIWYSEKKEAGYTHRYWENGGTFSLVREGDVLSGLQLSTYGSFAFSEDEMTSWQLNPYSGEYAMTMNFQDKNYLYFNANTSGTATSLVTEKGQWHHVSYNITNDNVILYVDGEKISTKYYNYWGNTIADRGQFASGQAFNLGTGWAEKRRYSSDSAMYAHGITLLDFISLENTVFTIGGKAALRAGVGPADFETPEGIKIADIHCYAESLSTSEIKTLMNGEELSISALPLVEPDDDTVVSPTPTPSVSESPVNSETPVPTETESVDYLLGDVDDNKVIDAADALLVLQHAAKLTTLDDVQSLAANVDTNDSIDAADALLILQYAAKIIDSFTK